jgi:hypothetical protein
MQVTKRAADGTPREVILDPLESVVSEIFSLLLDQGLTESDAMITLRGSMVPPGLRTKTEVLDKVLTPDFVSWLVD